MSYFSTSNIMYIAFVIFLGYFLILMAYYAFLGVVGFIEGKNWSRKKEEEDYPLAYFTTFEVPVSIVIAACNEEVWIKDCVKSILNLNYPKFELIIVDDGSVDNTFKILNELLELYPTDMLYVRHYKDGKTHDVLRSKKYPHVRVVRKAKGAKKAGAINAGLNIAKYDYICVMDADTVLEQDSLLKVMAEIYKDLERIVGIGSYFGLSNGLKIREGIIAKKSFSYNPILAYQNLEYIRSFFGNRVSLSKFNAMPNVAGGFGVWRKDILYELGGFSSAFTCEDIELTFRAHKYCVVNAKKDYKILMLPYHVAWTEGPDTIYSLIKQRDRWQRVVIETIWKYKFMLFNPKYGSFGFLAMPYYVFYEVLGVFFEIASLVLVIFGYLSNVLDKRTFLAYFMFMLICQAFVSIVSLLSSVRAQKIFSTKYTIYLALLSVIEFLSYRWIVSIGKLTGTINYFRGVKVYDQYVRGKRS